VESEKKRRSPLSSGCRWAKSLRGVLSVNWAKANVSRYGLAWPLRWSDRGGRGPSTVYVNGESACNDLGEMSPGEPQP
jgi:hypothetical protein